MKINAFRYRDQALGWYLEPVKFQDFTLLIGASGVGKTRILDSLSMLKEVANGASARGISWSLDFHTSDGAHYEWKGVFENEGVDTQLYRGVSSETIAEKDKPRIQMEHVKRNGKDVVKRTNNKIFFDDKRTPKLSQQESILKLLKEEELIAPAYNGFKNILFNRYPIYQTLGVPFNIFDLQGLQSKYQKLEQIRNSDEDLKTKLYLVFKNERDIFKRIKDHFVDFFPQVEDIKVEPIESDGDIPSIIKERPFIQIKEKGVEQWIYQSRISSGMFRTLMHICELYLAPEGTVILIDEFENSLGVNCIDQLTDELLSAGRGLQYIVTSHHPYIINNIDFKHWKLVTRFAHVVRTLEPEALNLGKSKHDAFIQLINLEQYKNGIGLEVE